MTSSETTVALLFPGQGSHAVGMEEPYRDHPLLTRGIELLGFDPFERLADGTRSHQPALFLCSICQWASGDHITPLAAAGHSLGEYAALTAAGAIDFEDAVKLVHARADAMAQAAAQQPGGMVAMLKGEREDVLELADELGLSLANDNAPGQIVLSGAMEQVPTKDLREAERMNAFYIVPASVKGSVQALFSTHPPMEKRIERLQQMEAQLQRQGAFAAA